MFKNILVSLTGSDSDAVALETAYLVGRLFDARLDCICARPSLSQMAIGATPFEIGGAMNAAELMADLQAENELRTKNARVIFNAFCGNRRLASNSHAKNGVSATWREITGDEVETTIAEARFNDLVVLGRPADGIALSTSGIGAVIIGSGRPVLLAPQAVPENIAPTVAIAWKDRPEAARAIAAAAPLLMKAHKVVVLTADEGTGHAGKSVESADRIAAQLRGPGCAAEARLVVPGGRTLADSILDTAKICGADVLVMGGYGHSRVRELVFGGFTRDVLNSSSLPVFLFH